MIINQNVILISFSIVMHFFLLYVINSQFRMVKVVENDNVSQVLLKARLVRVMPKKQVTITPLDLEQYSEQSVESATEKRPEKAPIETGAKLMESTKLIPKNPLMEQLSEDVNQKQQLQASDILAASRRYLNATKQTNRFVYKPHQKSTTSLMTGQPKIHVYHVNNQTDEEKRQIKVSCNNGTKKALVVISGLFGGTIQCQKSVDLSQFIKPKYQLD